MSRALAQRLLLLVCMAGLTPARVLAQREPVPAIDGDAALGLPQLWREARLSPHHGRIRAGTRLAPFVTSGLPEDAAWEGFVTPASSANVPLFIEYQGKLVMQNNGIAGSVVSPYLTMWDGANFESLPTLNDTPTGLGVWNDHLVVATTASNGRFAILMLDGARWDTLGVANDVVETFVVFQSHLIAGGRFASVSGVAAPLVAAYDGSTWTAAGTGLSGSEIKNLRLHVGALVAAGSMTAPKAVASLGTLGGAWQAVGAGFTNTAGDVVSYGGDLYACGHLGTSGGVAMGDFARWNGTSWTSLNSPSGTSDDRMTLWNGKIILNFKHVGTTTVGALAQWDGVSLTAVPGDSLGLGFGGAVSSLGTWGTNLVVTGTFVSNGSRPIPQVATCDGAQWGTIGVAWAPGMTGPTALPVFDMLAWGGKLIVMGKFGILADQDHWAAVSGIAAWDGAHWTPLGAGLTGLQTGWLGTYGTDLIAAGGDMVARGIASWVARWNGTSWSALGTGAPNWGTSIAEFQGNLYVGSEEPFPDTTPARWNGSTWSDVGGGTDGQVYALAQAGGRLVVGGYFAQVGVTPAANVAFWDGTNWQAAGAGVNDGVLTATEWQGQPVIGGDFTASGATALPGGVATWDGAQWQPMGTRAVVVAHLHVIDGELFASGDFKLPDDSIIEDTIAHWTGTDWKVLGSGSGGYAFEGYNGYLYQQGVGLVHGHPSHNLSRALLSVVLDVARPGPHATLLALSASPNPSRNLTGLSFTLPSAGHARLTVVDLAGRIVATLADGPFDAGGHQARWSAAAPAGVYFARLEAPGGVTRVTRVVRFE